MQLKALKKFWQEHTDFDLVRFERLFNFRLLPIIHSPIGIIFIRLPEGGTHKHTCTVSRFIQDSAQST